jgi:hypothetical protein
MAHVTFIHRIANKVPEGPLLKAWLDALRDNDGPDLGSKDVTTSMCYWADVLYEKPLSEASAGAEATGEDAELACAELLGMEWFRALSQPEQAQILELAAEVGAVVDTAHVAVTSAQASGNTSQARHACEVAVEAAPHADGPQLDLAAVLAAEGLSIEAHRSPTRTSGRPFSEARRLGPARPHRLHPSAAIWLAN